MFLQPREDGEARIVHGLLVTNEAITTQNAMNCGGGGG